MKRLTRWAALALLAPALLALALAGCSLAASSEASAEVSPAVLDPLTGKAALWPGQRPLAVPVERRGAIRGISDAELVLEALTQGETTPTLCLVYPALAAVPDVGPVARGQDLFWQLLSAQQFLPVQRGGGVYGGNFLDLYGIRALDALELGVSAFHYEGSWGQADSLSWYTSGAALSGAAEDLGFRLAADLTAAEEGQPGALPALLPFGEGEETEPGAEGVDAVRVAFSESSSTGFEYDEAAGVYRMTDSDGTPLVDLNTGEQAAFDNLLILYSAPALRDDGYTWGYDLTMGGGYYLSGGQIWNILWTQGTDTTLAIYNAGGKAIEIRPGRSYIALLGSMTGQQLSFSDSTGARMNAP